MKEVKFSSLVVIFIMIFSLLTCCSNNKFNAALYNNVSECINETFLKNNRVKAYYLNENYIEDQNNPNDKYIYDTTSLSLRTFIIYDEEYNRIFSFSQLNIDFEMEMVILHIFSNVNPTKNYKLQKIEVIDERLIVKLKLEGKNNDSATMPYQRCIAVKLDKVEINEVKFER